MRAFYFIILCIICKNLSAQDCVRGITTNPDNTVWPNPPYNAVYKLNFGTNKFDWRQSNFSLSLPTSPTYHSISNIVSPFFRGVNYDYLNNIIAFPDNNGINNDYNPQDGWELIRKDFGYRADGTTNTSDPPIGPYIILYNKYSGTLRVIGWLPSTNGDFSALNVRLSMPNAVTGIFSYYNKLALPLDQPSSKIYSSTPAFYPPAPDLPFFADFKVAYDPCTCNTSSTLRVSFEKVQEMSVTMYGRFIGTSTPVDYLVDTKTNIYDFKNYLTSVYDNLSDYTLNAGMMTYSSITSLISDYNASANASSLPQFLKDGFGILSKALLAGSKSVDRVPGKQDVAKGLEAAATISDFFSSAIGSTPSSLPSVIQGEMSLVGKIKSNVTQNFKYVIANPGSLGSDNAPECCSSNPYYPMYNEVLGVFALLSTPQVSLTYGDTYDIDPYRTGADRYVYKQFQLSSPLQYVFNPAVKVNLANSRVYASYEMQATGGQQGANLFTRYTTSKGTKYTTPVVPIESLSSLLFSYGGLRLESAIPTLSLMLDLEFQDLNKNGAPNRALYVITYPVSLSFSPPVSGGGSYAENLTIGTTNYAASNTISAWKNITVTGNLTTTNGATATFNTGGNSVLTTGSSIGTGIIIKGGNYPFPVNYSLSPQTTSSVNSFCASSTYKANTPLTASKKADDPVQQLEIRIENKLHETTAYPNPAQSKVSFQYYVEEPSNVKLAIQDLTGQVISVLVDSFQEAGFYDLSFETTNLSNGVYIYTLETSKGRQTKRLLIAK